MLTISGTPLLRPVVERVDNFFKEFGLRARDRRENSATAANFYYAAVAQRAASEMRARMLSLEDELRCDLNFQPMSSFEIKRRLFVFDMDSTLIECEVIDELAKLGGVGEQVAAVTAAAMRGELDFKASFRERIALLRGLQKESVERLVEHIPLTPGADRLIAALKAKHVRTAIVSGGFTIVAKLLQQRLGIEYAKTNELQFENGCVSGQVCGEIVDAEAKAAFLLEVARRNDIAPEQTVAVGDGANDLKMLAAAGSGIAYRAKPVLREAASLRITYGTLNDALHLVSI